MSSCIPPLSLPFHLFGRHIYIRVHTERDLGREREEGRCSNNNGEKSLDDPAAAVGRRLAEWW
jgi:hypothetical protein